METLAIQNFKFGLDTRREQLISVPGTLIKCENGHVTQGGEVAKRKAFVLYTDASFLDSNGDQGTFGLQKTQVGLFVFGSAYPKGTLYTGSPLHVTDVPALLRYVWCPHPEISKGTGTTYDRTKHRVTAVKFSQSFNGLPFVCCKFADGAHVLYNDYTLIAVEGTVSQVWYQGKLVRQSANGQVYDSPQDYRLADDLVFSILDTTGVTLDGTAGDTAPFPGWYAADTSNGQATLKSPAGITFGLVPTTSNTARRVGLTNVATNSPGQPGTPARVGFTVAGGAGTVTLSAPKSLTDSTQVTLLTGFTVSGVAATVAAQIVAAINAFTTSHGYFAFAVSNTFSVYAPPEWGNFTGTFTYTVTGATTLTPGATAGGPIQVLLSRQSVTGLCGNSGQLFARSDTVQLRIFGGSGSFTIVWEQVSNPHNIGINSRNSATTDFSGLLPFANTQIQGSFRALVTDSASGGGSGYSPVVTVTLTRGTVTP